MVDINLYRGIEEPELANGDPVIVVPRGEQHPRGEAVTLGTGFEGYEMLARHLERAAAGQSTIHIPMNAVEELDGAEGFDVFGIDGHIDL